MSAVNEALDKWVLSWGLQKISKKKQKQGGAVGKDGPFL
jgi:hypothetical protein